MDRVVIYDIPKRLKNADFENFTVYPELKKQVEAIKNTDKSITICGTTGAGKSHLAVAKAKSLKPILLPDHLHGYAQEFYINERDRYLRYPDTDKKMVEDYYNPLIEEGYKYRPARVKFVSTVEFLIELNETVVKGEGRLDKMKSYIQEVSIEKSRTSGQIFDFDGYDYLILDDFGAEKISEASRQNLYYMINERYENMLNVIVTSNLAIEQVKENEPRIASRLAEMGIIVNMKIQDYRTRRDK